MCMKLAEVLLSELSLLIRFNCQGCVNGHNLAKDPLASVKVRASGAVDRGLLSLVQLRPTSRVLDMSNDTKFLRSVVLFDSQGYFWRPRWVLHMT